MRRIETIRGLGRLVPPLICNRPGTGGRYLDQWSCHEEDQDLWNCREAQPSDTTPELWAAEGCGRALIQLPGPTAATVQTAPGRAPQAPPPAVSITDPERIRREQEDASRREWYRYHQENERARKERERIEAARLERERIERERIERERIEAERVARLERERIQAEQEQQRIQEELERNRRQLAERQQVTVTVPVNAPPGVETQKGGFPWWLLALLLVSQ